MLRLLEQGRSPQSLGLLTEDALWRNCIGSLTGEIIMPDISNFRFSIADCPRSSRGFERANRKLEIGIRQSVCCFALLLFVMPDMLAEKIDVESVVGLIAPRPFLAMTGETDRLSPVDGVQIIYSFQEHLYKLCEKPENFRGLLYPGVGHEYTPEMWKEAIDWLKHHL
jgi:hypothetical protein